MEAQKNHFNKGGSMRLGSQPCRIQKDTKSFEAYRMELIQERHRHRYEVNNAYRERLSEKGLIIAGINPDLDLVEIIENKNNSWFVGVQFHPEFQSKPNKPHPLFIAFIKSALNTDFDK
jgi:CTP synthase